MALIKCIECGMQISSLAVSCPHCGCPAEYQEAKEARTTYEDQIKNADIWQNAFRLVKDGKSAMPLTEMNKVVPGEIAKMKKLVERMKQESTFSPSLIIEFFPNQAIPSSTAKCSACRRTISAKAETCPHCGQVTGVHVCPKCGSVNTAPLTGFDKVAYTALFGVFAAKTVVSKYWCKDCRFEF